MSHVIADCHLVKDEAWVLCACGVRVEDPDPEHINEPFQVHRALNGEKPRRPSGITELKPPQGIESLMWRTINPTSSATRRKSA